MTYQDLEIDKVHTLYAKAYNAPSIPNAYSLGNTVWCSVWCRGIGFFGAGNPEYTYPTGYLFHTPQTYCLLSGKYIDNNSC